MRDAMSNISARPKGKRGRPPKSRKDPTFKPTTGGMDRMGLTNADPSKHYVFVDPSIKESYSSYLADGYKAVYKEEGGVNCVAGTTSKDGEVFEAMGCILMSIDKKVKDERDAEGLQFARGRIANIRAKTLQSIRRDYRGVIGEAAIDQGEDNQSMEDEAYG